MRKSTFPPKQPSPPPRQQVPSSSSLADAGEPPADWNDWRVLGLQHLRTNDLVQAQAAFTSAVELAPHEIETRILLGRVATRNGDEALAYENFEQAVALDPLHFDANAGLGEILYHRNQLDRALVHIERALQAQPEDHVALQRKVHILGQQRQYEDAAKLCEQLIARGGDARYANLNELGNIRRDLGQLDLALECYRQAAKQTAIDPAPLSNQITLSHYLPDCSPAEIFKLSKQWGRKFAKRASTTKRPTPANQSPARSLRIGMISDGFRQHPVGAMITPALEQLGQFGFELYFYSTSASVDPITVRLQNIATQWSIITKSTDSALAERIKDDGIDILIDLAGHNSGSRMRTIAMEPAPLIVKWVGGLINTTGVESFDYLITDGIESPPGSDDMYTEKLIRMPDDYICYMPPQRIPPVASPPAERNGYITFGCFNNPTKVNDVLLEQWARVLHAVPGSRLYLKGGPFNSPDLQHRVQAVLAQHGIDASRVRMEGHSKHYELFECYNDVDIALDPWPYSGGLTTCEAMLMGVPVITLPGPTFAGRHSATHLFNAGMPELITHDWDEYIARAQGLANDLQSLATIRSHLRRILLESAVCNGEKFAGHLADALRAIWQRYCEGKTPAALSFTEQDLPLFEGDTAPTSVSHPVVSSAAVAEEDLFKFSFEGTVVVMDHGAGLASHPDFAQIAGLGAFSTITIDPASKLKDASLLQDQGYLQHYHAHLALGQESSAELHVCLDAERSGTLQPLPPEQQLAFARQGSAPLAKLALSSARLDEIEGLTRIDWLWLDDANDNLGILHGATRLLDSMLILQVGVRFIDTYEKQPGLHDIEAMLKPHGFRLLRLNNMRHHSYLPEDSETQLASEAQLVSADAVFVPDTRKLDKLDKNQRLKLAFLLHTIYQAADLAFEILAHNDTETAQRYLECHQALESWQPKSVLARPATIAAPAAAANLRAPLTAPIRKGLQSPSPDIVAQMAATISTTPHMEPEGQALLAERLGKSETFLEYGSGGSSVMAAQSRVKRIYSVDSDETFLRAVQARIEQIGIGAEKYQPIYVDIGPTGDWGRPRDFGSAALWPAYANEPWTLLELEGASPDLILIDGRFRVASFLVSALLAQEGCVILFDDYFDRPGYHIVEKYLKPVRAAGRMAEFVVPAAKPPGLIQELIRYCTTPD